MSNRSENFLPNFRDASIEPISKENSYKVPEKVPPDDEIQNSEKIMDNHQVKVDDGSDNSHGNLSENGEKKKIGSTRPTEVEEVRADSSADDMDLEETIDSHIGVRMEGERQRIHSIPSENEEDEDDMGMDSVNILDSLPLEGAPIEGQEVSEADLLGKINDEDDGDEQKSPLQSAEDDNQEDNRGKRRGKKSDNPEHSKKKFKKDDEKKDGATEGESKSDKKQSNMRRNIREVMDETQLDEATLAAQRQEMERLRRVQEQQRIIREVQHRQLQKGISLLRSNQSLQDSKEIRLPSSVQLRVNSGSASGSQTSINQANLAPRRPISEISRSNTLQQRIRMMTPSVSISPVASRDKKEPIEHLEYYTDSDLSDVDDIEESDELTLQEKQMQQARKLSGPPKPAKSKDVVTISSSSENSDDDCIVLSDPSETEETDTEDDPTNSGMHTNDRYNVPDDQGRILVNVGHPEDEPDVFLAPQIARIIKPHQIGGIRFLFDNIVESIDRYKTSTGFGCILAHSMGLGKTLQVASFCDIFFRCTDAKTVLCIMPINTLQNWLAEFNMWLPYEDPNKPKVEEKLNAKEEVKQNEQMIQPNPQSIMQHNPYTGHPAYNPNVAPHYGSSGGMYDSRYTPTYSGVPYTPIKSEPSCHPQQINPSMNLYGVDGQGTPQYPPNPNYSQPMQYPPGYSNMDPNIHSGVHGMSGQMPPSMYPGYGAHQTSTPYPNYGNQPKPEEFNIKKENNLPQDQKTERDTIPQGTQKADELKKETDETKKEDSEEKKEKSLISTPFSVDAPPELETRPRHFNLHILNDSHKTMAARARVIREWQKVGGVLLIGYELYRQLSLKKQNKTKRKRGQPMFKDPSADAEEENKNKPLLDEMHSALVNPGPDLVICDEGHRIKNSHASISLALKQMRTKRRIVLTGYPLQNNLLEYWCMVDFVRPNYLGTKNEFCNMFERPIQNGQCIDSTPQDIRLMRYRAHVLHALLEGFVQRRSHSVLQVSLPRKEEYILLVRMTPHQRKLYDIFMNEVVKKRTVPNPLKAFAVCCKIWNHPDVLYHFLKKRQANEEDDLDLEETMGDKANMAGGKRVGKPRQPKGEGKKGKKAALNAKNKPAASILPNSASDNQNPENDPHKQQLYSNFSAPPPHPPTETNFQGTNAQNAYSGSYQNYRPDDRSTNYQGSDYKDYYNNQNQQSQQKYSPVVGQNYSSYPQDSNYQSTNPPPQHYQGRHQNYNPPMNDANIANNDQRYAAAPPPANSNFQQNSNTSGNYPQQNYPYQEQSKNYSSNSGQGSNNSHIPNQQPHQSQPPQQPQQHLQPHNYQPSNQGSNQTVASDYGPYPPHNQNQGYNYPSGAQQPNSNVYMNNQQPISNSPAQNTTYSQNPSTSNPGTQSFQNMVPQPNPPHPPHQYPVNSNENVNSMTSETSYNNNNNNNNQQSSQQTQAYQANVSQNQVGGYQNTSQNSGSNYNQIDTNQSHAYSTEQQHQAQHSQIHQQHGFNQQSSEYPPGIQQSQIPAGQTNYSSTQPTSGSNPISHGYQSNPSNQMNYSQNNEPHSYPTQNVNSQNFSSVNDSNPPHSSSLDNQSQSQQQQQQHQQQHNQHQNQQQQHHQHQHHQQQPQPQPQPGAPAQDQYWQKNYQNTNNYTDPNANQYHGNYSNSTSMPGNSQTNQSNPVSTQSKDFSVNSLTDYKPPQQGEYNQQVPKNLPNSNDAHGMPNPILQNQNNSTPSFYETSNNVQNKSSSLEPLKEKDKDNDTGDKDKMSDKSKEDKSDDEVLIKDDTKKDDYLPVGLANAIANSKEEPGIPYDWAVELMKGYVPGLIDASAKMSLFFCILEEGIRRGDRILTFSQSLFTLNLIEDFLARNSLKHDNGETENWAKNVNYYRLDGSTSALEREKLINEFNANKKIHLFLVSTRAGSLGINLVGANRAIVFDASWNPCHDTQAVCRVYRYGQKKNCYVYRLVTDNCLERKIYDRQISKQGMADRVVDQCNPDAHLSLKEAATLSWDWEEDSQVQDFSDSKEKYNDEVMRVLLEKYSKLLTKQPFHHESLLVDRKDKKLSQAEKKLARRGYELEKMAATNSRPSYNYIPGNTATRVSISGGIQVRQIRSDIGGPTSKPVASVRPMQQKGTEGIGPRNPAGTRWIPAEVWQRQGMSAQEMTLPLDVVIPTNSPDKGSIVLKAGQKVMVLKSPKGIYMQLESGKIISIRTALKINQQKKEEDAPKKSIAPIVPRTGSNKQDIGFPLRNNSAISIIPKSSTSTVQQNRPVMKTGVNYRPFGEKEVVNRKKPVATAAAKPYSTQVNANHVTLSGINKPKQDNPSDVSSLGENSNSSDGHKVRPDQRVEEVHVEDLVCESGSNSDYSPSSRPSNSDTDSNMHRQLLDNRAMSNFSTDTSPARSHAIRPSQDNYIPETNTGLRKFDQSRGAVQKDKKAEGEFVGKDSTPYNYPPQSYNAHQSHHVQQPIIPQHQNYQPQHLPQQQQQTQHLPQQQYHQPPPIHQEQMPHQAPSHIPQQSHSSISQPPYPQPQQPHRRSHQPPQQPQQPSIRNPPRPIMQRNNKNQNKPVQSSISPPAASSTRLKSPSREPIGSQSSESMVPTDAGQPLSHGYPYGQYPRYYDYEDPRSRQPTDSSYSPYYPPALSSHTTSLASVNPEVSQNLPPASQLKILEQRPRSSNEPLVSTYPKSGAASSKNSATSELPKIPAPKPVETTTTASSNNNTSSSSSTDASAAVREEPHIPTAFSHPSTVRSSYPAPFPPAPYDPYAQHYPPPGPTSATGYPPPAAPGYGSMYGGSPMGYDPEYARMYSAFHGPPPPTSDPYRGYAPPPASHPSNYYSPFPHPPPPPYPNYSFLPPYPNPNVPAEPQPPAQ